MAMIEMKEVSKWYGTVQVLNNCTTSINKGEVVVVCGPSGSGKSTLIKCANALEPFQKGEVIVDGVGVGTKGTDLPKLRSRIGMVFQHFELFPHLSIMENLTLGQTHVLGRSAAEADDKGMKLLERVGLKAHAAKFPEPDGPHTTTTSPLLIAVVQSVSTWKLPYHLLTPLNSIMAMT